MAELFLGLLLALLFVCFTFLTFCGGGCHSFRTNFQYSVFCFEYGTGRVLAQLVFHKLRKTFAEKATGPFSCSFFADFTRAVLTGTYPADYTGQTLILQNLVHGLNNQVRKRLV